MTPPCSLCASDKTVEIRKGVRENPTEPVYICNSCGFLFLTTPTYDLREFYREEYRKTYSSAPGTVLSPEQHFNLMKPLMERSVAAFRELVPKGGTVLEIGCSSGSFLDAIRGDYEVYGNEWNERDAAYVRDTLGIPCSEEQLEQAFPGKKFTAIVALQVVEHVPAPAAWLKLVRSRLIGGGWVYLETPNSDEALVSIYGSSEYRDRWFRKAHLGYFNMHNLGIAINVAGFNGLIRGRQRYGLGNHIWWQFRGEPMPDPVRAQGTYLPVPKGHPAANVLNRFFFRIDQEYRNTLDTLKAWDTLIATGRNRDI